MKFPLSEIVNECHESVIAEFKLKRCSPAPFKIYLEH